MVKDHNDKIPKDVNNEKAWINKETVNEKKKEEEKSVG